MAARRTKRSIIAFAACAPEEAGQRALPEGIGEALADGVGPEQTYGREVQQGGGQSPRAAGGRLGAPRLPPGPGAR